ncbi:hypothetical protein B7P43_G06994 [Cryptotermes secundus]|uniref:Phosphatidylinositol-specific phospholipase C X domain-containing protein n=1 Tax=Cryptotermes secundus TaxID=105785 RepID=A0A2J7Q8Y6_9NEOP|nr:hypothetical protein B7P43_G06994 [Cryptotermes secundus]
MCFNSFAHCVAEFADTDKELQVSIIVSPVPKDNVARRLILSWENASPLSGDWIGLFNEEPTDLSIPLFVVQPHNPSGWAETTSHETASYSQDLGYSKKCLGFWAAYKSAGNSTLASSCLHTEPTWMSDLKTELSPLLLRQIFLPGTHDAGAYDRYNSSSANNLIVKYTITQEEDILSQLVNGVRYLDIRAAYYNDRNDVWWVNHGAVPIHPLQTVFDDVQTFLQNTNEIVILDFHEFPDSIQALLFMRSCLSTWSENLGILQLCHH